jgi:hypothetical protein
MTTSVQDHRYGSSSSLCDYVLRRQIEQMRPQHIVDFGAGGGKNGRIARELLGNDVKLIAVEGFESAAISLRECGPYDEVCHDLLQHWTENSTGTYDLAIFGDVLEHLTPKEIHIVVQRCLLKFSRIIIVCPLHDIFQESCYGNPLEVHRAYITDAFFDCYCPIEKHLVRGPECTIMNAAIDPLPHIPLYRRASLAVFHVSMIALQPLGLARPFVNLLKRNFLRHKWMLRG